MLAVRSGPMATHDVLSSLGIVSIAGEYRLSDQKNITPLEAMSDVRDLIRWVRENFASLVSIPIELLLMESPPVDISRYLPQSSLTRTKAKSARCQRSDGYNLRGGPTDRRGINSGSTVISGTKGVRSSILSSNV
jgi:hypothetical protein